MATLVSVPLNTYSSKTPLLKNKEIKPGVVIQV
jgi:hypothetical protein